MGVCVHAATFQTPDQLELKVNRPINFLPTNSISKDGVFIFHRDLFWV
jgi:hypothetical protein